MVTLPDNARNRFDLSNTVAWIPGGTGLLGSAVSLALAEHGAHVVVSGRVAERAESVAASIRERGLSAETVVLDVRDEEAVESTAASIVLRHGHLDSCVNLAYHSTGKTFLELTAQDWDEGMRATATSAFLVGRAAGRVMATGGSIVQFSSMYGMVSPDPRNYPESVPINPPDYGFAKAGILQLVRYQAVQLGPRGVRVNAVVPGPFPSPAALAKEDFGERLRSRVPLGRTGMPEEIVGAVIFLCAPAASFVTGTSIVIDGGWTAW